MRGTVLIIDDEEPIVQSLRFALEDQFEVDTALGWGEALSLAQSRAFDAFLVDLRLKDCDGLELLKKLKNEQPDASAIVMTAYGSIGSAVECMRNGANDYITKPLDIDELRAVLSQAVENSRLRLRVRRLDMELERKYGPAGLIGRSAAMQKVFQLIEKARWVDSNVLILGESGTGKELVARALHYTGKRKHGPFEAINCSAIPESLLESELFGYEKGAFTGASCRKHGRIELADGGTLFLDEIGDMSWTTQAKILRVIQERSVQRLGATVPGKVDVRIVAASNKDLKEEVSKGNFREDLFYRLNVLTIHLPPLRERKEDIPLLAEHFVGLYAKKLRKNVTGISERAMKVLTSAEYKGNVRELENAIERAVAFKEPLGGVIDVPDLPEDLVESSATSPLTPTGAPQDKLDFRVGDTLKDLERKAILETLRRTGGRKGLAARMLGISERCLRNKLKEYSSASQVH